MKTPKRRVVIPDEALRDIPPEEREEVKRFIREAFENAPEGEMPGRPATIVSCVPVVCLACGAEVRVRRSTMHTTEGPRTLSTCTNDACEAAFISPAMS